MSPGLLPMLRDQAASAWPLWAGAAAAVMATLLLLGPVAQWQTQAEEELAAASRARQSSPSPAAVAPVAVAGVLILPEATQSPERSARLARLARRHGLQVQRLREQFDAAGQLQLSLSGQAPYASWRAFVAAALAADPALALDRLRLQRADADAAVLDADTQWTFLHRGATVAGVGVASRREVAR
jgi:hypothetical protein